MAVTRLYYCDVGVYICQSARTPPARACMSTVCEVYCVLPVAFPLAVGVLPPERVFVFLREVTLTVIQTVDRGVVSPGLSGATTTAWEPWFSGNPARWGGPGPLSACRPGRGRCGGKGALDFGFEVMRAHKCARRWCRQVGRRRRIVVWPLPRGG